MRGPQTILRASLLPRHLLAPRHMLCPFAATGSQCLRVRRCWSSTRWLLSTHVTTTSSSFTCATIAIASLHARSLRSRGSHRSRFSARVAITVASLRGHSSVAALPLRRRHICVRPLLGARPTASAAPPLLKWVLNCVRSVSLIRRDRMNPHLEIIFSL